MNDVSPVVNTVSPNSPEVLETTSPERIRSDCREIRRVVSRMAAPFMVRRGVMVVIAAVVYWFVARAILRFGAGVSYEGLGLPDSMVVSMLTRVNIYLWWALVVVLGLVVFFWLKSAWRESVLRERAVAVAPGDVRAVAETVSVPVLNVLRWVWADHNEPITQGDLRRTLAEVRSGRIKKMRTAIEQQEILGARRPI